MARATPLFTVAGMSDDAAAMHAAHTGETLTVTAHRRRCSWCVRCMSNERGGAKQPHLRHVFDPESPDTPFYSSDTLLISFFYASHFIGFHLTPILSHFDSREVF